MPSPYPSFVILLRAIGPVTHARMTMTQWRQASEKAGFLDPETLVNTGNMLAEFDGDARVVEKSMTAVLRSFDLGENVVPVVRRPDALRRIVRANPLPEAVETRPSQVGIYFFKASRPAFNWLDDYNGPEAIRVINHHLVVDFTQDVAQSGKLIRLIDKHCGINTSRNWNSVRRIAERVSARNAGQ